ncbi:MAG: pantetheine-phosphate adenylyltransferase [Rikenellaceae bacterium]|nr:pantetheine-phosphate adenylyltransferase [Rikenellaceae bacterium]
MAKIALFAGSFDPFTRGHEAVVEEALRLFDEVVIGVGENVSKRSLLSVEQRCRLIADVYKENNRVRVASYSTLTGDFARQVGATVLVRGVRNTVDFEMERTMEATNRELYPELTTVLLVTPAEYMHISSSMVRELLAFGRKVDEYLPQSIEIEEYIK